MVLRISPCSCRLGATLVALLLAAAALAQPIEPLPVFKAGDIAPRCDKALADLASGRKALERVPLAASRVENVFGGLNRLNAQIEDISGPVDIQANVHPDSTVRKEAEDCLTKLTQAQTELFQSEALFKRVSAVKPRTAVEAKLGKDLIEQFEDTGVTLPKAKRERAKALFVKLEELRQAFDRNVRDDPTKVTFTPDEMKGLPRDYLTRAKKDDKGNYVLGTSYPEYDPFIENAQSETARKRYYEAFVRKGGEQNLKLLDEMVGLRKELASLYGLPSYAHFATRRRMVERPETVDRFLKDVHAAVEARERAELAELKTLKASLPGQVSETVNRWDALYLFEQLKRARYDVDQEGLRRYFPTEASVAWVLKVSGELYGIRFEPRKVPAWHETVRYYDVVDAKSGEVLSGVYLDLFPREGKYNHAAVWPVRGSSKLLGRKPLAVLVTNLNDKGLNHDELETLLHEFGHALHTTLSKTDYLAHAGTNVALDFVEAPSQMYEEWTRHVAPLRLFKDVCADCPLVDEALMARINAARDVGRGVRYARQWLYASYDLALTSARPGRVLETWQRMERATPLGHVEGTMMPASFGHLAGGYAAGYYGYLWSEVLALDMATAFGENFMSPAIGARYRKLVLERGASVTAKQLVRDFLGREPSPKAFYDELAGKRLTSK